MLDSDLRTLRDCQDRVLEQEGIPMVLALVSEVGDVPIAQDDAVRAAGEALSQRMDAFRAALIPSMREDDNGALISVMQAVSYADFGTRGIDLPADAADVPRHEVGR